MRSLLRAANDRRFWGAFGAWAAILAVLAGASVTIQVAFGLSKFGGLEYVPRVAMVSIVRELGPGSACGALVLSLITWAHYLSVEQLCDRRERILPVAILASAAATTTSQPAASRRRCESPLSSTGR